MWGFSLYSSHLIFDSALKTGRWKGFHQSIAGRQIERECQLLFLVGDYNTAHPRFPTIPPALYFQFLKEYQITRIWNHSSWYSAYGLQGMNAGSSISSSSAPFLPRVVSIVRCVPRRCVNEVWEEKQYHVLPISPSTPWSVGIQKKSHMHTRKRYMHKRIHTHTHTHARKRNTKYTHPVSVSWGWSWRNQVNWLVHSRSYKESFSSDEETCIVLCCFMWR